jgi:uncharacterized protein YkwD
MSFCFFTVVFQTVAHAQTMPGDVHTLATNLGPSTIEPSPTKEVPIPTFTPISLSLPNPTSTPPPNLSSDLLSPTIQPTITPTPTITPLPISAPSPTITKTLISTKTPTITPTTIPTSIPTTVPTAKPTPQTATAAAPTTLSTPGGLNADKLFDMANAYRQSKGLPILQKDDLSCQLAASRAPEIASEIASGTMHSGLRARALPYWNTENIISLSSEEAAFNWWINDTIHRDAIVGNYTYSCVACSGNSCAQEFTNYQPK